MSVQMPAADQAVLARRAEIVAALRAIVPGEGVIDAEREMRPFESDGLTAYRQLPMVVVLPDTPLAFAYTLAEKLREQIGALSIEGLADPERREEAGTPAIVESIRAGLVFQLKQAVGTEVIRAHEEDFLRRAVTAWNDHPRIEVLGNLSAERLSIVSFVLRSPSGRYLHHNFVVSVLNDLFGIQSRGGCSCAGPYGHRLLGIDINRSHEFEREIARGCEGIKPGWVRVNFNYFIS